MDTLKSNLELNENKIIENFTQSMTHFQLLNNENQKNSFDHFIDANIKNDDSNNLSPKKPNQYKNDVIQASIV